MTIKRFNSSKVKCLGNLAATSEKQKAYLRRVQGIKSRFAVDNDGELLAPSKPREPEPQFMIEEFTPAKRVGRYGSFSGSRLDPMVRLLVQRRAAARGEFMREIAKGNI